MTVQRKKPPQHVQWDQVAILRRISDLESAIAGFTQSSSNPSSDSSAAFVRNVRDHEILSSLESINEVLERIQLQLSFVTDTSLNPGDS